MASDASDAGAGYGLCPRRGAAGAKRLVLPPASLEGECTRHWRGPGEAVAPGELSADEEGVVRREDLRGGVGEAGGEMGRVMGTEPSIL